MAKITYVILSVAGFAVAAGACQKQQADEAEPKAKASEMASEGTLVASIQARAGSPMTGEARFKEVDGGVRVALEVENAPPGQHGVHIHEKADCSAEDFSSAGGHFAPRGYAHGLPGEDGKKHLGDLGNMDVAASGQGQLMIEIDGATLEADADKSFRGRALVVHAGKDTGEPPSGSAGRRIACAKI